jgi:uncharacterized protein (DUF1684 family)
MTTPGDPFSLAHWRRSVAKMYATLRRAPAAEQPRTWEAFRTARNELFKTHPQTPLIPRQRAQFSGLAYYAYDPAWRTTGTLDRNVERETLAVELPAEGSFHYTRVAWVRFRVQEHEAALSLFWIEGYGGGLFLPFRDASNSHGTYGGGRYLYDTIKGADLGAGSGESGASRLVLDFNYAYNPSCAYNEQWVCPLAPPENWLPFPVHAGEKAFKV